MLVERLRAWWNPDHEPVLLQEPLRSEAVELLRARETVQAMKIVNHRTGIGLVATKRAVEHLAASEGLEARI